VNVKEKKKKELGPIFWRCLVCEVEKREVTYLSLLHVSVTTNHHQAEISIHEHDMFSVVSLMMVTFNRNMKQILYY